MGKIRVALAEDNVLLREGVSRLVSANEEFELVGTASDLPQLLALVREQLPDVVITDIRMPPTGTNEGIQAAAWLHENHPEVGVVVLSQYTAPAGWQHPAQASTVVGSWDHDHQPALSGRSRRSGAVPDGRQGGSPAAARLRARR